ncbi:MAG: hypothetical protein AAFX06_33860, partial [Planctomycetota bacterium]
RRYTLDYQRTLTRSTDYDENVDALDAIHAEWTRRSTWRRKLANLRSGQGDFLNRVRLVANETVHDDGDVDRRRAMGKTMRPKPCRASPCGK